MIYATQDCTNGEVVISLDDNGLILLERALSQFRSNGDHVHLFGPDWGGYDLDSPPGEASGSAVSHIKIVRLRAGDGCEVQAPRLGD